MSQKIDNNFLATHAHLMSPDYHLRTKEGDFTNNKISLSKVVFHYLPLRILNVCNRVIDTLIYLFKNRTLQWKSDKNLLNLCVTHITKTSQQYSQVEYKIISRLFNDLVFKTGLSSTEIEGARDLLHSQNPNLNSLSKESKPPLTETFFKDTSKSGSRDHLDGESEFECSDDETPLDDDDKFFSINDELDSDVEFSDEGTLSDGICSNDSEDEFFEIDDEATNNKKTSVNQSDEELKNNEFSRKESLKTEKSMNQSLWPTQDWDSLSDKEKQAFKATQKLNHQEIPPFSVEAFIQGFLDKNDFYKKSILPILNGMALFAATKDRGQEKVKENWLEKINNIVDLEAKIKTNKTKPDSNNDSESYFSVYEFVRVAFSMLKMLHEQGFSCMTVLEEFSNLKFPDTFEINQEIFNNLDENFLGKLEKAFQSKNKEQILDVLDKIFHKYFPAFILKLSYQVKVYLTIPLYLCFSLVHSIQTKEQACEDMANSIPGLTFLNPLLSLGYWTPTWLFNWTFRKIISSIPIPTPLDEKRQELVKFQGELKYRKNNNGSKKGYHSFEVSDLEEEIEKMEKHILGEAEQDKSDKAAVELIRTIINDMTDGILINHSPQNYISLIQKIISTHSAYINFAKAHKESEGNQVNLESSKKNLNKEIGGLIMTMGNAVVYLFKSFKNLNTTEELFSSIDECIKNITIPDSWIETNFLEWSQNAIAPYFNKEKK
jgi:hypothetical protein